MHYYPFDRQSCEILIVNRGIVKDNVELIAEELIYNGPEDYLEYFIQAHMARIRLSLNQYRKIISQIFDLGCKYAINFGDIFYNLGKF